MPLYQEDLLADSDISDPLRVERSGPIDDQEAAVIDALCHAATPGPLVTDDMAEGEGTLVASLPDGRSIISLSCEACEQDALQTAEANLQLICRARHLLLRLLRDRQRLQERLAELESLLGPDGQQPPSQPR